MTIVCYRDGVLAADSLVLEGGTRVGQVRKFRVFQCGTVIAFSGHLSAGSWFLKEVTPATMPDELPKDFNAMKVDPHGDVYHLESENRVWFKIEAPFHAIGSGSYLAIGAMAMGADAREAVTVACTYETGCGGPIRCHAMPGLPRMALEDDS